MDSILYSIYKTQDNNFLVEDNKDGKIYKFNTYSEIMNTFDTFSKSKNPQFASRMQGTIPSNPKGKVDIYETTPAKEPEGMSQPANNYGWYIAGSNPHHDAGGFTLIGRNLLKSIQEEMRW
jgi:hypothetical protein